MNPDASRIVVLTILTVEAVVWLVSASLLIRNTRASRQAAADDGFGAVDPEFTRSSAGALLKGMRDELLSRAASTLASAGLGSGCPVRILDKTAAGLVIEPINTLFSGVRPGRFGAPNRVRLNFIAVNSDQTRIDFSIDGAPRSGLLKAAWIVQGLGLFVMILLAWLLLTYVAGHPNPAVRGQSFQMIQAIHALWPPFLLMALYRRSNKELESRVDAFVNNLPYL